MTLRFGVFDHIDLTHEQAMRSIELFATEAMPGYSTVPPGASVGSRAAGA